MRCIPTVELLLPPLLPTNLLAAAARDSLDRMEPLSTAAVAGFGKGDRDSLPDYPNLMSVSVPASNGRCDHHDSTTEPYVCINVWGSQAYSSR